MTYSGSQNQQEVETVLKLGLPVWNCISFPVQQWSHYGFCRDLGVHCQSKPSLTPMLGYKGWSPGPSAEEQMGLRFPLGSFPCFFPIPLSFLVIWLPLSLLLSLVSEYPEAVSTWPAFLLWSVQRPKNHFFLCNLDLGSELLFLPSWAALSYVVGWILWLEEFTGWHEWCVLNPIRVKPINPADSLTGTQSALLMCPF